MADSALGMLDFLLERLVFLVGLHRQHLLTILGNLGFEGTHFTLELFARRLVVFDFFASGIKSHGSRTKLFIEGFGNSRELVDSRSNFLNGEVETLETNEL